MPTRSDEAKDLIQSLPIKLADIFCNGRTPNGYCRHKAGFRTNHLGKGRCWLHGGASSGAPIKHGMYSKKMNVELKKEFEDTLSNPELYTVYEEVGILKLLLQKFIEQISKDMALGKNVFIDYNEEGVSRVNPQFNVAMTLLRDTTRALEAMVKVEEKSSNVLTVRDVVGVTQQIRSIMTNVCTNCPCRPIIAERFNQITIMKEKT